VIRRSPGKTIARRMLIGAVVLLVPALAGCEAGQNAPTLQFHPAAGGQSTVANDITISNAFVLGPQSGSTLPAGSSASFFVGLYNSGTDDALVSASAPGAARSVMIEGGSVSLPANASANLTGPQPQVVLAGLTKPLMGGEAITVKLEFAHAGEVTLDVPVEPHSYYYSSYSQAPAPVPTPATTAPTPTGPAPSPSATGPGATTSPAATTSPTPTATKTP
jgi:copper(I)-binding protein